MITLRKGVIALVLQALLLPGPTLAAAPASAAQLDKELDEVLVEGRKPERSGQKIIDWMARLVGEFTFEGHVDLHGRGNSEDLRQVQGAGNCTGFGPAPAVQCEIRVRWPETTGENGEAIPGGVPHLDPAMILYGFEPNRIGIRYMLVDSKGVANFDLAMLVGDTLVSRKACADIPGNCQRVMLVTAAPDLKLVEMRIVLEVDYQKALEYAFVMRRVPGSSSVVHPGRSEQ